MINRFSTYTEITKHLSDARTGVLNSMDCMVGRDTYPLLEPDAHPSDVFVCSELERLNGQIDALRSFMLNGIEWERSHQQTDDEPWPYRISCAKCDKVIQAPTRAEMPNLCPHCGKDYCVYP